MDNRRLTQAIQADRLLEQYGGVLSDREHDTLHEKLCRIQLLVDEVSELGDGKELPLFWKSGRQYLAKDPVEKAKSEVEKLQKELKPVLNGNLGWQGTHLGTWNTSPVFPTRKELDAWLFDQDKLQAEELRLLRRVKKEIGELGKKAKKPSKKVIDKDKLATYGDDDLDDKMLFQFQDEDYYE